MSEWLRAADPALPAPPRLVGRGVVAASWELTAQAVRTKGDTSRETREALAYIWLLGLTGRPAPVTPPTDAQFVASVMTTSIRSYASAKSAAW